jgi:hypothetical protein
MFLCAVLCLILLYFWSFVFYAKCSHLTQFVLAKLLQKFLLDVIALT